MFRHEHITHVVVLVRRLALPRGNVVQVDVEDFRREQRQVVEAGLLPPLAERRGPRISLTFVVAAQLQPRVQPPVMVQEDLGREPTDDESAAGDVPRSERVAREAARLGLDEAEDRLEILGLVRVGGDMAAKRDGESRAGRVGGAGALHARTLTALARIGHHPGVTMTFDRPMLTVFCGARPGLSPVHAEDAAAIGRAIARAGAGLVYGGGRVGLMGILADAALEEGAPVFGVIPAGLAAKEIAHNGLTHLEIVATMHERKARMAEVATGFLALAGGFGTLDEFFEIVTWRQLGHHSRPIVLFNGSGYFDALLAALRHVSDEGFARDSAEYFTVETEHDAAVRRALDGTGREAAVTWQGRP